MRSIAAAWVARQVSRAAIVSCDQAMCQALETHRIPTRDLLELNQGTADPLRSQVIVATELVRSEFGSRLSSVYAPAVIARFGSGNLRIEVRTVAQNGPAAYRSELSADLMARKASGAGLATLGRIVAPAQARSQLSAGQVDSRLLTTLAGMAALHQLRIVAFGDSAPGAGASAGSPLRSVDVVAAGAAAGAGTSAYIRSMLAYLRGRPAPFLPARARTVRLADGRTVLDIQFDAPSPLGLLNPRAS